MRNRIWKLDESKTLCADLILPYALPSYWTWSAMHWSKRVSAQKRAQQYLDLWYARNDIRPFGQPVLIFLTVWRRRLRGDEPNLVTPFDKIILDALTRPSGNKKRGMGIIVDDSPQYMKLLPVTLRKADPKIGEQTVVRFYPWRKGESLTIEL